MQKELQTRGRTMPKKKMSEQVKDTAKSLDERMKKYRIYKEVAKDFLLMMPLFGSVGSTVLNWLFGAYAKYTETARLAVEKASKRASEAGDIVAETTASAPPAGMDTGDMIQFFFIFWLVVILCWRAWVKVKAKLQGND